MPHELDIIAREVEIGFMEASVISDMISLNYFSESVNEDLFDKIIKKVKETVNKMKKKVNDFITSSKIKEKLNEIKEKFISNPKLKNEKVKVPDFDKLDKLNKDTIKELENTNDVEATMNKYRKQRNKILAGSALITVSLASAFVFVVKKKDEKISELEKTVEKVTGKFEKAKKLLENVRKERDDLKRANKSLSDKLELAKARNAADKAKVVAKQSAKAINSAGEKYVSGMNTIEAKVKANTEVLANASKDILNSTKQMFDAISGEKSPIKKVGTIGKETSKVLKTASKVASGDASKEAINKRKDELKEKGKHLISEYNKAKNIYNDLSKPSKERERAKAYMDKAAPQIKKYEQEFKALK